MHDWILARSNLGWLARHLLPDITVLLALPQITSWANEVRQCSLRMKNHVLVTVRRKCWKSWNVVVKHCFTDSHVLSRGSAKFTPGNSNVSGVIEDERGPDRC